MRNCQDEHDGHFTGELHPYNKSFVDASVRRVKTPYATYIVCADCAKRLGAKGFVEKIEYLDQSGAWVDMTREMDETDDSGRDGYAS